MINDELLSLPNIAGITPENVEDIFNRNFTRWRYFNSSEVKVNGKVVDLIEKTFLLFPDENGNSNITDCTVSDTTKNGFPLTKETFITEELKSYKPKYESSIGSKINRENNLKLKLYIDFLENEKALPPQPIKTESHQSQSLGNIITHAKSADIVEKIKVQYKNIKGKRLKLLLMALQELQLLPKEQIAAQFHRCCVTEFNWEIASYTAMNDYIFNPQTDKDEYNQMLDFLNDIINTK